MDFHGLGGPARHGYLEPGWEVDYRRDDELLHLIYIGSQGDHLTFCGLDDNNKFIVLSTDAEELYCRQQERPLISVTALDTPHFFRLLHPKLLCADGKKSDSDEPFHATWDDMVPGAMFVHKVSGEIVRDEIFETDPDPESHTFSFVTFLRYRRMPDGSTRISLHERERHEARELSEKGASVMLPRQQWEEVRKARHLTLDEVKAEPGAVERLDRAALNVGRGFYIRFSGSSGKDVPDESIQAMIKKALQGFDGVISFGATQLRVARDGQITSEVRPSLQDLPPDISLGQGGACVGIGTTGDWTRETEIDGRKITVISEETTAVRAPSYATVARDDVQVPMNFTVNPENRERLQQNWKWWAECMEGLELGRYLAREHSFSGSALMVCGGGNTVQAEIEMWREAGLPVVYIADPAQPGSATQKFIAGMEAGEIEKRDGLDFITESEEELCKALEQLKAIGPDNPDNRPIQRKPRYSQDYSMEPHLMFDAMKAAVEELRKQLTFRVMDYLLSGVMESGASKQDSPPEEVLDQLEEIGKNLDGLMLKCLSMKRLIAAEISPPHTNPLPDIEGCLASIGTIFNRMMEILPVAGVDVWPERSRQDRNALFELYQKVRNLQKRTPIPAHSEAGDGRFSLDEAPTVSLCRRASALTHKHFRKAGDPLILEKGVSPMPYLTSAFVNWVELGGEIFPFRNPDGCVTAYLLYLNPEAAKALSPHLIGPYEEILKTMKFGYGLFIVVDESAAPGAYKGLRAMMDVLPVRDGADGVLWYQDSDNLRAAFAHLSTGIIPPQLVGIAVVNRGDGRELVDVMYASGAEARAALGPVKYDRERLKGDAYGLMTRSLPGIKMRSPETREKVARTLAGWKVYLEGVIRARNELEEEHADLQAVLPHLTALLPEDQYESLRSGLASSDPEELESLRLDLLRNLPSAEKIKRKLKECEAWERENGAVIE